MKLKSGTPNLHDVTRQYAGDPLREEFGGTLYKDAEIDNFVNLKYLELWRRAKSQSMGWGVDFQLKDSTASTIWYNLPTNLDSNLVLVEIEPDGKDIDSDSTAQPVPLDRGNFHQEWLEYTTGNLTDSKFWLLREGSAADQYGIIAPPATGGTNAIRLTLEVEATLMTEDDTEPRGIPSSHRELICLLAAEALRVSVDMDPSDVLRIVGRLYPEFIQDKGPRFGERPDYQMACAGRSTEQSFYTRQGFARRGNR